MASAGFGRLPEGGHDREDRRGFIGEEAAEGDQHLVAAGPEGVQRRGNRAQGISRFGLVVLNGESTSEFVDCGDRGIPGFLDHVLGGENAGHFYAPGVLVAGLAGAVFLLGSKRRADVRGRRVEDAAGAERRTDHAGLGQTAQEFGGGAVDDFEMDVGRRFPAIIGAEEFGGERLELGAATVSVLFDHDQQDRGLAARGENAPRK